MCRKILHDTSNWDKKVEEIYQDSVKTNLVLSNNYHSTDIYLQNKYIFISPKFILTNKTSENQLEGQEGTCFKPRIIPVKEILFGNTRVIPPFPYNEPITRPSLPLD